MHIYVDSRHYHDDGEKGEENKEWTQHTTPNF
jgi:hypothetical protein